MGKFSKCTVCLSYTSFLFRFLERSLKYATLQAIVCQLLLYIQPSACCFGTWNLSDLSCLVWGSCLANGQVKVASLLKSASHANQVLKKLVSFCGQLFLELTEILWEILNTVNGNWGVYWEQSVAGAASPWGHICVLCSLSGNILIWSLCFYKTGQDLFYPWAICIGSFTKTLQWWRRGAVPCVFKNSPENVLRLLSF